MPDIDTILTPTTNDTMIGPMPAPPPAAPEQQPITEQYGLPNLADKFNTKLSPDEEKRFLDWYKNDPHRPDPGDYDVQGWWKEFGDKGGGTEKHATSTGEDVHYPDTFKKPNSPTFSDESIYHGKDGNVGGKWRKDAGGKWSFEASPQNIKQIGGVDKLKAYFAEEEPDATLILPTAGR